MIGAIMDDTETLAKKHLAIAIQLMGRDWVVESCARKLDLAEPSGRGRKPGVIPEAARRCAWHPEGRDQCKNSRSGDTQFCKIHVQNVILLNQ